MVNISHNSSRPLPPTSQNSHTALLIPSMHQNPLPDTSGKTVGLPSTDLLFVYPWSLYISHMIHQCSLHLTSPHCRSLSIILWWPIDSHSLFRLVLFRATPVRSHNSKVDVSIQRAPISVNSYKCYCTINVAFTSYNCVILYTMAVHKNTLLKWKVPKWGFNSSAIEE